MTEEQTAHPNSAAMTESNKQMALAFAKLRDTCRVFGYSLIVPTNAIHADAPPCSDAPLGDFQVTDSTDQRTRVQLDVRKDNDAHVRGQPLFYGQIGYDSDVLDPERVKKDNDVVEKLLPLIEKQGSSSVLPSSFKSTVSPVTTPDNDSALLFFPSSTTQFIVKASTQSPATTLTALSLINSNSLDSSDSNNHNDDNDGNISTPSNAPVTNPPVPPPLPEPPPAPSSSSLYFSFAATATRGSGCVCVS
jgi:hypothetical protein